MLESILIRALRYAGLAAVAVALLSVTIFSFSDSYVAPAGALLGPERSSGLTGTDTAGPGQEISEICSILEDGTWQIPREEYVSCGLEGGLPEAPLPEPLLGPTQPFAAAAETQNETTVAVEGDTLCAAWNDGPGTGIGRSTDRGATFTDQAHVDPGVSLGDPVLAVDADGDFALAHMLNNAGVGMADQIVVSFSQDE